MDKIDSSLRLGLQRRAVSLPLPLPANTAACPKKIHGNIYTVSIHHCHLSPFIAALSPFIAAPHCRSPAISQPVKVPDKPYILGVLRGERGTMILMRLPWLSPADLCELAGGSGKIWHVCSPIMLQGGYQPDFWGWAADVWDGVGQLRAEAQTVFGKNDGG